MPLTLNVIQKKVLCSAEKSSVIWAEPHSRSSAEQFCRTERSVDHYITVPKRTASNKLSTVSHFEQFLKNWFSVWQAGEKKCNGQLPKQPANSAKIFVIVLTRHITLHTAHTKRNAKKTFWLLIHCGQFCIILSEKLLPILMLHSSICQKNFGLR